MGQHRSESSKRTVSKGLILAVVALLVIIAAIVGWFALRDHAGDEGARASGACVSGDLTVPVAAAPSIAPTIEKLANDYQDSGPVVRDHCVQIDVRTANAADIVAAAGGGSAGETTADGNAADGNAMKPSLWVAESSTDVAALRAAAPDAIDGQPNSVAASPVVLATDSETAGRLGDVAWQDLPARQSDGSLGLAMPNGGDASATELTLAAAIADAGPDPAAQALTADAVKSPTGRSATDALLNSAPGERTASASDVLASLHDGDAAEGVRAVPTTAHALYEANRKSDADALSAVRPAGPTPVVDYPAVLLQVDEQEGTRNLSAAASNFANFMSQADQQSTLAGAGFLVSGGAENTPAPTDGGGVLTGTPPEAILPGPADDAAAALASTLGSPATATGASTTILLDVSGSMSVTEGDATRLGNVTRILDDRVGALPDSDRVGLWVYSAALSGSTPYVVAVPTGVLTDDVGGTQRRQAIVNSLDGATPRTATHTYRSLQAAYASAVEGYTEGGKNSVLLITDGPNDDQGFKGTQSLLDAIARAGDPARPVAIDVVAIGPNDDIDSLREVADATGGTVTEVPSSDDPALTGAVNDHLG